MTPSTRLARAALALALILAAVPALATDYTWNGGGSDDNWSTAANWGGTAPTSSIDTNLFFGGSTRLTNTNDLGTLQLNKLTINSGAGAFSLSGNDLDFRTNSSSTAPKINNNSGINFTLANNITLTNTLTLAGGATNTISGVISGSGGITSDHGGSYILSNTANTYTGVTTSMNGALTITKLADGGQASSIGASTNDAANLVLGFANQNYTGSGDSTDRLFTVVAGAAPGLNNNGTGAVNFTNTGAIAFSGTGTRIIQLGGSNTADNTFAPLIADQDALNNTRLNKNGDGTWVVTNSNTYTGSTSIGAGTLKVTTLSNGGSASSLGKATNDATNLIFYGGTLKYTGSGHSSDRLFTLAGSSGTLDASGTGAINFTNSGSIAFSGSAVRTLGLAGTNTGDNTLAALIGDQSSSNNTHLTKSGSGTWVLGNSANSYTGVTIIMGGGTLTVSKLANGGTASSIGQSTNDTANLVIRDGSTLKYVGAGDSTNRGFTIQTGDGVFDASGTGALNFTSSADIYLQGAGAGVLLTLTGSNNDDNTMGVRIWKGSLTKSGTGTWVLGNASNSYTGVTTISGGTLKIASLGNGTDNSYIGAASNAASNIVLDGGTLKFTGAATTNRLFTVGTGGGGLDSSGGTVNFSDTGALAFSGSGARTLTLGGTNTGDNTLAAVIGDGTGGATSLVKSGTGTWVLTGTNTYTGGTTINAGTLKVGADANLGDASSAVMINSGGTLKLTGNLSTSRNITVNDGGTVDTNGNTLTVSGTLGGEGTYGKITIANGGTLAPGSSPGTVTATDNVTFNSGSTFAVEVESPTSFDRLYLTNGNVTIGSGALLDLTISGSGYANGQNFLIIENAGSGTLSGTFSGYANGATVATESGFHWKIYYGSAANAFSGLGGNDVALTLTPVPEPGSIMLVCAAASGLGYAVRKRWRRMPASPGAPG